MIENENSVDAFSTTVEAAPGIVYLCTDCGHATLKGHCSDVPRRILSLDVLGPIVAAAIGATQDQPAFEYEAAKRISFQLQREFDMETRK